MNANEIGRALVFPIVNLTVLIAFISFYLLLQLIVWIVTLGPYYLVSALILAVFIVPALCLYLIYLLDARARGVNPEPPGVEHLHSYGSVWSLTQVLYYALLVYVANLLGDMQGSGALLVTVVLVAAVLPASLAILAVTHSPIESLHPVTIGKLVKRCGGSYWIAPVFFLVAVALMWSLFDSSLPGWLVGLVALYLLFAFYTLTGALMRPLRLHGEVDIHEPLRPDEAKIATELLTLRTDVLNHAYGFVSRGNRDGGFKHIHNWIADDPEPDSAWQWYFEHMMRWQDRTPALFFGQQYVARLLHDGDYRAATKTILRCRYENEAFQPFPEDREQAAAAAEHVGNEELAQALRAGMSGAHAIEVVRRR